MLSKFTTKKFFFSLLGLILATVLTYQGHMTGEVWVYALAVIIAGHHAEDLIKAWRGTDARTA